MIGLIIGIILVAFIGLLVYLLVKKDSKSKSPIQKKRDELKEVEVDETLTGYDENIVDKKTSLKKRKDELKLKEEKLS